MLVSLLVTSDREKFLIVSDQTLQVTRLPMKKSRCNVHRHNCAQIVCYIIVLKVFKYFNTINTTSLYNYNISSLYNNYFNNIQQII